MKYERALATVVGLRARVLREKYGYYGAWFIAIQEELGACHCPGVDFSTRAPQSCPICLSTWMPT